MAEQLSLEAVGPRVGIRVHAVWYVQETASQEAEGRASIRLATSLGEFSRDTTFGPEGLRAARSTARACGVELVIAHDLVDVVELWEVAP